VDEKLRAITGQWSNAAQMVQFFMVNVFIYCLL